MHPWRPLRLTHRKSEEIHSMIRIFNERRDLVLELLKDIPGFRTNVPEGAFYVFPNINYYFGKSNGTLTINNAKDLCLYVLEQGHVALVPGDAFGNPNCIRLSYAASKDQLIEAIRRIKEALKGFA